MDRRGRVRTNFQLDRAQQRVVHSLWVKGAASRLDLARNLGFSPAAMTAMARDLMAMGLVEEAESLRSPARGRPSVPLQIARDAGYAIGAAPHHGAVDVTLVDFHGSPIASVREAFEDTGPEVFARQVRRIVHELVERHHLLGRRLIGCGVGVPGPKAVTDRRHWLTVPNLPTWRDIDLQAVIGDALALPVWIENDANAAALADFYLAGVAQRCRSALVILFGHGIGAGVIENGRLAKGQNGNVGEIGLLFPSDRPRPSTVDLLRCLRAAGHEVRSADDVAPLIAADNETVASWTRRAAAQLDPVISNALAWFDPGEIILSGPLPQPIREQLALLLSDRPWYDELGRPAIRASAIGEKATVLGAALLPILASAGIAESFSVAVD